MNYLKVEEWLTWLVDARNEIKTKDNEDIYSFMDNDRMEHLAINLIAKGNKPRRYHLRKEILNLSGGLPINTQITSYFANVDMIRILFDILNKNKISFAIDEQQLDLIIKELIIKYNSYIGYKKKEGFKVKSLYNNRHAYFKIEDILVNNKNINKDSLTLFLEIMSVDINEINEDYHDGLIKVNDKYFCITLAYLTDCLFSRFEKYIINKYFEDKAEQEKYYKLKGRTFELYSAGLLSMICHDNLIINAKYYTNKGDQQLDVIYDSNDTIIIFECKSTNFFGNINDPKEKDIEIETRKYLADGFATLSRAFEHFKSNDECKLKVSNKEIIVNTKNKKIYTVLIYLKPVLMLPGSIQ